MLKIGFIVLLFILVLIIYLNSSITERFERSIQPERNSQRAPVHEPEMNCYINKNISEQIELLDDVLISEHKPQLGKSIFFHETSCGNGIASINARQACAVESAARSNPNSDIFLFFASPVGFRKNETKHPFIEAILSYGNVHLRNLNLWSYAQDTPLNDFINTNKLFRSKYLVSHTSDFLRYLSLFKWGGTYLDLDVVVKRSFDSIQPNYAGAESLDIVAAGVINFANDGVGHEMAKKCLKYFKEHFNGNEWGNNGPGVITGVLKKMCKSRHTNMMTRDHCHGFRVLEMSSLYAVDYQDWSYFFDEKYTDLILKTTANTIVVHVWNKLSILKPVRVGSNVAYGLLASRYCPKVYASCGEYF